MARVWTCTGKLTKKKLVNLDTRHFLHSAECYMTAARTGEMAAAAEVKEVMVDSEAQDWAAGGAALAAAGSEAAVVVGSEAAAKGRAV